MAEIWQNVLRKAMTKMFLLTVLIMMMLTTVMMSAKKLWGFSPQA
jgi:succinate dehydrogenase hydrophobic anchor subunit